MTAKATAKKITRKALENKYIKPVVVTAATPVLVVAYPFILTHQLKKEYNH